MALTFADRSSADKAFSGLSGLPFNVAVLLLAALGLTLLGSVGVGGNLVPIKAQAGDRIHEPLTYRPGFMTFNHRIVPGAS
mmetsp:Transcript_3393/g.9483  ORF Transcript_3393/g.9483 Transcript_3393/m.9483 type:complete len:81 (-) Transcript_3393:1259-1501(-)